MGRDRCIHLTNQKNYEFRLESSAFGKSIFKVQDKEPVASAFTFGIGLTFTLPVDESVEITII